MREIRRIHSQSKSDPDLKRDPNVCVIRANGGSRKRRRRWLRRMRRWWRRKRMRRTREGMRRRRRRRRRKGLTFSTGWVVGVTQLSPRPWVFVTFRTTEEKEVKKESEIKKNINNISALAR